MPGTWVFPRGAVDRGDGTGKAGERACAIRELREETELELPADADLVAFSCWITPEVVPIRFRASFCLATAPPGAAPHVDGKEIVDWRWFTPAEALSSQHGGEMNLPFPTRHQLEQLSGFANNQELLAAFRGRPVEPILPIVDIENGKPSIVLP